LRKKSRIFIAGENTMEGKALIAILKEKKYNNIINLYSSEPDLTNSSLLEEYFNNTRPEYIFHVAGKSGGIKANQEIPATLMLNNLKIISNVISLAHKYKARKLLYLASSCTYPKHAEQPMSPEMLMTGPLEPTNSAYATAKLTGVELCRAYQMEHGINFISAITANVFGPCDDFSAENSHVISGLIRKMDEAKVRGYSNVKIWGSGKPQREFIYIDDLADACLFVMDKYNGNDPINIGSGTILSIAEMAQVIISIVGFDGELEFDLKRPDGMPVKTLNSDRLNKLGWTASVPFHTAIKRTYNWFEENNNTAVNK